MTDSITGSGYRSYLVRFWQSTEQGGWHASAQCVQSGNTVLFGNVESLLHFLQKEIKLQPTSSYEDGQFERNPSSQQEKPK